MSEETKKTNLGMITLAVVLSIIMCGLAAVCGYLVADKELSKKTNDDDISQQKPNVNEENPNLNSGTDEKEPSNEDVAVSNASSSIYVSDDENYILTLGDYKYNNYVKLRGTESKSYLMYMFGGYNSDFFYGDYSIENGKINLAVFGGCLSSDGKFNCILPNGVTVTERENVAPIITLDYSEDSIKFGSNSLVKK